MTAVAAEEPPRVGPYRVLQAIGAGGSARIDLARIDRAYGFQRHVVLKRPLEHLRGDASVAASLRREARIGGQLRHPNLVAVLDAGVHDGYDYLVLEYVHGAALRAVMHADQPGQVRELPLAVALAIVADAARGMHEAHELADETGAPLGLVHRDVSPGNILIGLDGTVKLADFGIAKETRVSTLSGSIRGTVTYMAPEQCRGHAYDRRADVFSLGVILYELVTATRLFWADNDVASLHRVLSGVVPRPRTHRPQLAAALEDIVMTAVAHDAVRRFPSALALATEIERYAADAGEVLGARWIARTVADVVGARQVPWIAAPTQVEVPPSDGSLVALIAAADPDEALEPSFGDADEPAVDDAGPAAEAIQVVEAVQVEAPVAPAAPARRPTRIAAGLVAIVAIASAAVIVLVVRTRAPSETRTTPPPASPASPSPASPSAASPSAASPSAASPSAASPSAPAVSATPVLSSAAPATDEPEPEPATTPPVTTPPRRPQRLAPTPVKPKRRPHASRPSSHQPSRAAASPAPREAPPGAAASPAPGTAAPGPTPTARPAAKVEWKPTLLLPTDGTGAGTRP